MPAWEASNTLIWATRAHYMHHMAGSKPYTHLLQNQDRSRCMCGVGQKKTKQAGQRGTCQHSRPSSHIWATRAYDMHEMAGSNPITHMLKIEEGSRCMCGVGRNRKKQAGQRGTCQHSWPASHIWATRPQYIHHVHHVAAASGSLTRCKIIKGSRCMCGVGRKKTKQASQRGTCQHG